jgi:flagellin
MERLSSGSKINSASDDAAGFAIAERMTAQIRGLNMAAKNAGDGLSMLSAIENATNDVTDMLQRMRELAVQAVNDTNTDTDRDYLQGEVTALLAEINRVAGQTQYNGEAILDGTRSGNIQVGTEAGQTVGFSIASIHTDNLGTGGGTPTTTTTWDTNASGYVSFASSDSFHAWSTSGISQGDTIKISDFSTGATTQAYEVASVSGGDIQLTSSFSADDQSLVNNSNNLGLFEGNSVTTNSGGSPLSGIDVSNNPTDALATITAAIEQVAGDRAEYGALQNRLEYTVSNLMNVSEFTTAARSRIADADFAAESARLAKAQVLQQSGTAMLAQANASSQLALSLIR